MTGHRRIGFFVWCAIVLGSLPAFGQSPPAPPQAGAQPLPQDPAGQWAFRFTPYGWLTFMSGSQTVKGHSVSVNTNVFQTFSGSQSLIPFMGYFEARYQDRISLFLDVMYANLTAGQSSARIFTPQPGVSAGFTSSASVNYETLTVQFGGAYQLARVGPDRSAEGPGMSGVGQTAFDVLLGGRYWYQRADLTLNVNASVAANTPDLVFSADGSRAFARSGGISWVDPIVGGRVRHKLAPGQDLTVEADIGGFGIGSRISWQAIAAYNIDLGRTGRTGSIGWAGVIGYRALYVDYSRGSGNTLFEMNLLQHGPLFAVSARF